MGHKASSAPPESPATASESNVALAFIGAMAVAVVGLLLGSGGSPKKEDTQAAATQTSQRVAKGKVAVATAAPEASEAALAVLEEGGNAYDALVASSFVVSVVRPQSTGIGGGGFVLYYDAEKNQLGALDGREAAPGKSTPDMFVDENGNLTKGYFRGPLAAGTPGLVALLYKVHQEHGSEALVKRYGSKQAAWARLVQPAYEYASKGCAVSDGLARAIKHCEKDLAAYESSKAVFLPGGKPLEKGALLVQPDLAKTLRAIAEQGANGFYRGWVASALARASQAHGGILSRADLEAYEAKVRTPVVGTYGERQVVSFPIPSSGGTILVEMLNMLELYGLQKKSKSEIPHHSALHVHLLAEVMRRAYADRTAYLADGLTPEERQKVARLTTKPYAQERVRDLDIDRATPSARIEGGLGGGDHTTHISIVDAEGNAVASTQTINTWLGSCFVAEKTGVVLNNEMNDFTGQVGTANHFGAKQSARNLPGPFKRPLSSMSPTIVLGSDSKPEIVVGAAGGTKIITTVLQIISNVTDFGLSPEDAMGAPRMHHQHDPDLIRIEKGLKPISRQLGQRGHVVEVYTQHGGICEAQLLVRQGQTWVGVSDPRGDGEPRAK